MKELFGDFGKKVVEKTQEATEKAKQMAESVKLKSLISDEEKTINSAYTQIGKRCCEIHNDESDQIIMNQLVEIKDAQEKIKGYTEQLNQLKGTMNCSNCSAEIAAEAAFCASCGNKMN